VAATGGAPRARGAERGSAELVWAGKARPTMPSPARLQVVETAGAVAAGHGNALVWGDNLLAMRALLDEYAGRVNLIYVDPPFASGAEYVQRVPLGEAACRSAPITLMAPAYRDAWGSGRATYLQMLYERLVLMHALLADGGALYVHLDPTVSHYVKVLLDEVFGPEGFQREIVWRIGWVSGYKSAALNWVRNHDTILYYTKGRPAVFNKQYVPYPAGYRRRAGAPGRAAGYPIEDVWNANVSEHALGGAESLDSIQIKSYSREKTGFPTQKSESLLRRIIAASSREGELVADFFCGSGTTLAVAQQLGRRWIGCDESWRAIHTTRKRLLAFSERGPSDRLGGDASFSVLRCTSGDAGATASVRPRLGAGRSAVGPRVRLNLEVVSGRAVVKLQGYTPTREATTVGFGTQRRRGHWADYVDFWAVDFEHQDGVFHHQWWSHRSRAHPDLASTSAPHAYAQPGAYRIAVRVVDVFGVETTTELALIV
jgi:adenine-specific DNA-methyltransferase